MFQYKVINKNFGSIRKKEFYPLDKNKINYHTLFNSRVHYHTNNNGG